MKNTIKDIDVNGKKVLLRVDFNVPLNENGKISDDNRILEALATINYLIENKAKTIICSHLGRPKGVDPKFSLKVVAEHLSQLVKAKVIFATDIAGKDAKEKASKLQEGEILLLENLRFDDRETENDEKFCKELASLAEIYINDAFGSAHRKHASTYGVAKLLPNAVGFLMGKEIKVINSILNEPKKPFVAVLGGAKISDKISVLENLINIADTILVAGGMAFTFIKALGGQIGKSLVDNELLPLAKNIMEKAKSKNVNFILPVDVVANTEYKNEGKLKKFDINNIPQDYMGLDIGPKTIKLFKGYFKSASTIVWNGTLGVCEFKNFSKGTHKLAKAVSKSRAFSFIGGGDTASAFINMGFAKRVSHISTGGGASLTMLEGKVLPGVDIISDKK